MNQSLLVRCPNCGGFATRSYFTSDEAKYTNCDKKQVLQTECSHCDYLMVTCYRGGDVIEAYSSSTSLKIKNNNSPINSLIPPTISPLSA